MLHLVMKIIYSYIKKMKLSINWKGIAENVFTYNYAVAKINFNAMLYIYSFIEKCLHGY